MSDHARFVAPARIIAALTAVSRVLGLVREAAYSYFFGIDPIFSSFRVAFMVPNLARRLFGEGAMASAFVPVFTEVLERDGRERARELAGSAFTLLGAILLGLMLLIQIGVGTAYLVEASPTLSLTLIMMPYMVLICLAGFAGGMLNALGRFTVPAAAPTLLNVALIATLGVGGFALKLDTTSLIFIVAVAVVVAGVAQFGSQVLEMKRAACMPKLNLRWRDPDLKRILLLLLPMVIGLSAMQLNVLADNLIALFFTPERRGPAILGYAHMIYHLPQGVFGIALATAIFPMLSAKAAQRDNAGLARAFESGLRVSLFIALPASLGLILLATPIVQVLYERGKFLSEDSVLVSRTLICYCLGLWAFSIQPILARAFYALQDAKTPVRIGITCVCLNLLLSIGLVFVLQEGGIALATAIASMLQVVWLTAAVRKRLPELELGTVARSAGKTALAVAAMSGFLFWISRGSLVDAVGPGSMLLVAVPGGVVVFAVVSVVLGCRELKELFTR